MHGLGAFDFREFDAPILEPLDLYIEKSVFVSLLNKKACVMKLQFHRNRAMLHTCADIDSCGTLEAQ